MPSITSSGIGSGLDVSGLVAQLVAAERQPTEIRIARQEATVQSKLSAFGTLKSALSDFNGELDKLKELDALLIRKASSADEDIVTISTDKDAVPAAYDIEVVRLAQAQRLESGAFTDSDTVVGTGTLTIAVGGESFSILVDDDNSSLSGIRDAINDATDNTGVAATIVNSDGGSHLILSGEQTGADQTIVVTQTGGDGGLSVLEYDPGNGLNALTESQQAFDAEAKINGFTVSSDNNTIADAIDGVTLSLVAADPGNTTAVTVDNDNTAVRARIDAFVGQYNKLVDALDRLTSYDAETRDAGPLLGDSTVRGIRDQLRRELNNATGDIDATFSSLLDIGVESDVDGKLSVDTTKLDAVLESEFTKLGQLFASSDGYAVRLADVVDRYLDGTEGIIKTRTDGLDASIEDFADQRERLELRMTAVEARLLKQFNALDALVGELTTTSNFLTQQLQSLPKVSINQS